MKERISGIAMLNTDPGNFGFFRIVHCSGVHEIPPEKKVVSQ